MNWVAPLAAMGLMLTAPCTASAQDEPYPARAVRLVAAAAPGGNPDALGRLLAQKFTDALSQPFVIENMPGAGGVVAAVSVAKAAPDGHVLMVGDSGALAINAAMQPNLSYHPLKDFTPITALATVPTVLVAHPSMPATLPEFIALAKRDSGKLSYGSAGPGSIHHLTMAIFAERAGLDLLHVPYRGGSAMVNGLLTGEIQAGWSGIPNVMPLIEAGKLRAYCVSILERSKSVPAVPTCAELGYAGFDVATMLGLQGPAGLPHKVVTVMQGTAAKVMRENALTERMIQLGMVMQENGTEHYRQFMQADLARYATIVQKLGLQVK
jgi:tripartite-type tricarboxylate transporter receptor subunit TctC